MTHPLTPREAVEYWLDLALTTGAKKQDFNMSEAVSGVLTALASSSGDHAELVRLGDRNVELSVLAYKWMEARDALKSGQPYDYPSPADAPSLLAEIATLRVEVSDLREHRITADLLVSSLKADKAEAERKLAEAVELLRNVLTLQNNGVLDEAISPFLSKEAERG